jgi:hypothetical protein
MWIGAYSIPYSINEGLQLYSYGPQFIRYHASDFFCTGNFLVLTFVLLLKERFFKETVALYTLLCILYEVFVDPFTDSIDIIAYILGGITLVLLGYNVSLVALFRLDDIIILNED